jgi:hypothetical protein
LRNYGIHAECIARALAGVGLACLLVGCSPLGESQPKTTSTSTPATTLTPPSTTSSTPATALPAGTVRRIDWLGVSCASSRTCVAVGQLDVFDNSGQVINVGPGEVAVVLWQGEIAVGHISDIGVASGVGGFTGPMVCRSSGLCLAIGAGGAGTVATADGGATWMLSRIPEQGSNITAVACAPASVCVATDQAGEVLESTSAPAPGEWTWRRQTLNPNAALVGIACPTSSECIAVNVAGQLWTSSDPASPIGRWALAVINSRGVPFVGIGCAVSTCFALDQDNRLWESQAGLDTMTRWTMADQLPGAEGVTDSLQCSSSSCFALNLEGHAFIWTARQAKTLWREATGSTRLTAISCTSALFCLGISGSSLESATESNAINGRWAQVQASTS